MFPLVKKVFVTSSIRRNCDGSVSATSNPTGAASSTQWLDLVPDAEPVCGLVGAPVNVNDFSNKPAVYRASDETFSTGRRRFRFIPTPQVPHGWETGVLFEATGRTLLCSDLFHQWGHSLHSRQQNRPRAHETLAQMETGPFANYVPYTHHTGTLEGLAKLEPATLATMHGSSLTFAIRTECST